MRRLTFHELRHTFGTVAANAALNGRELQEWMGHADLKTTQRYVHYRARGDEASRFAAAFVASGPQASVVLSATNGFRGDAGGGQEIPLPVGVAAEPSGTP